MLIACDEAGHTGPDLLARDQKYFSFASINISDEEAWNIIEKARREYPVQMPELKASKLMTSKQGQRLISYVIEEIDGRFAINAHDKLMALCGWVFEYIFEPVYQDDPRFFYKIDFHKFIANFCYFWMNDKNSNTSAAIAQFQLFMRTKDITLAPILFDFKGNLSSDKPHPFELIQRFATGHKEIIATDIANIAHQTTDKGTWTLDLSASGLWSHLNHWGRQNEPIDLICDDSKPLRSIIQNFEGPTSEGILERSRIMYGHQNLGWELKNPIKFVDSRAHPSVQLADILASTVVYCYSKGLPEGMEKAVAILDKGMLRDSIFPDYELIKLENDKSKFSYALLHELAMTAEGSGTGLPIELYYEIMKRTPTDDLFKTKQT